MKLCLNSSNGRTSENLRVRGYKLVAWNREERGRKLRWGEAIDTECEAEDLQLGLAEGP